MTELETNFERTQLNLCSNSSEAKQSRLIEYDDAILTGTGVCAEFKLKVTPSYTRSRPNSYHFETLYDLDKRRIDSYSEHNAAIYPTEDHYLQTICVLDLVLTDVQTGWSG
jgi:hypothetical protein